MRDRTDYSHNGFCKLSHIPQVVARDNGKPVWLFKIDTFRCKIYLKVWSPQMLVSPIVQIFRSENFPPKIPVFLNIWNKNPKFRNKYKIESFTIFGEPVCGPKVPIFEILNLKNGFLDENGAMTIEYGFHFDGLFDKTQAMWKFNLNSKLFDGRSKKNMMNYVGITEHFSHKQLILFHDSRARIKCATRKTDTLKLSEIIELFMFEKFLQIAHGVQLKLEGDKLMDVIRIAHRYGVQNVLKYCEIQLIMKFSELPKDRILEVFSRPLFLTNLVKVAVHYNLNRLLAFLLNHLLKNSKIENRIFLEKLKLDEMTNDSMKMIVAKVVYGKS
ncbi:hypothetical protein B9Z55_026810 [Caenorhabditis nigoni]|uniref:BTB domain-containing protein n=1 Tax=Caenorhabditis nigoni TaxID=1611254 RepID=A0A2G5SHZ0_9PELO|nr:hypothetical protein B9Z55_026810 [Caenorhabditis nigoni]